MALNNFRVSKLGQFKNSSEVVGLCEGAGYHYDIPSPAVRHARAKQANFLFLDAHAAPVDVTKIARGYAIPSDPQHLCNSNYANAIRADNSLRFSIDLPCAAAFWDRSGAS